MHRRRNQKTAGQPARRPTGLADFLVLAGRDTKLTSRANMEDTWLALRGVGENSTTIFSPVSSTSKQRKHSSARRALVPRSSHATPPTNCSKPSVRTNPSDSVRARCSCCRFGGDESRRAASPFASPPSPSEPVRCRTTSLGAAAAGRTASAAPTGAAAGGRSRSRAAARGRRRAGAGPGSRTPSRRPRSRACL